MGKGDDDPGFGEQELRLGRCDSPEQTGRLLSGPFGPKSNAHPSVRAMTEISSGVRTSSSNSERQGARMRFRM